jgi:hypothetical protein
MTIVFHLKLTPMKPEEGEDPQKQDDIPEEESKPEPPPNIVVAPLYKEEYMDPEENRRQEALAKFIAELTKRQDIPLPTAPVVRDIPQGKKIIFGRNTRISLEEGADANFINLAFPEMSRKHAQVKGEGDTLHVKDLGSANGTFLNGKRLSPPYQKSKSYPLQNGDVIIFGKPRPNKKDSKGDLDTALHVSYSHAKF